MRDRQDVQSLDAGGFRRVGSGQHDRAKPVLLRRNGHRQRASHAHHTAGEGQLPHRRHAFHRLAGKPPHGGKNGQRNRQIIRRAFLAHVRRGEVERQPRDGKLHAAGGHRRAHALPAFLDRSIRQADDFKHRHAVHAVGLHRHRIPLYARQSHTLHARKHGKHFHFVMI